MLCLQAYGQTFIPDDHFLTLVATVSSVCNAAGRPFWGLLADRAGYRVGTGWVQAGYRVGTGWLQGGYRVATGWVQAGYRVGTGWVQAGYRVGTGWVQGGDRVGTGWGDRVGTGLRGKSV